MSVITSLAAVCPSPATPPTYHDVHYHQQELRYDGNLYCGPASAQMVLESIDAGLYDQTFLFATTHNDGLEAGWHSSPNGMELTMEARKPTGFAKTFVANQLASEEALSRKICWAIHNHGIAPIVLVYGDDHWIVVTGYTATRHPNSSTDTGYTIKLFEIHNPTPMVAPGQNLPPPHINCGDGCGMGSYRGTPHEVVAYKKDPSYADTCYWRTNYIKPVPVGSIWENQFIVICDPDDAANTQDVPLQPEGALVEDAETIVDRALVGLDDYELSGRDPWRTAISENPTFELFLVEHEDSDPELRYYLVSFRNDTGQVPMVVQVGAGEEGAFAGSIAAPIGATTHFDQALNRQDIIEEFVGQDIPVDGGTAELTLEGLYDYLVWQPCEESLSPYWPFYRFAAQGPQGMVRVYVRIDGVLFPELHFGRGM